MTWFLFSVWQLWVSWYGAPFLTRGWVCNLLVQLLLGLARTATLGSKFSRTQDHILQFHMRLPQPEGPGPCIYIPYEQGGPVIPPGTGFPFCRLLRLAVLRWRYSNLSPHGLGKQSSSSYIVKVTSWPTVSQPVMQCNVEFGYHRSIFSETKENHGKPWSSCKLTSSQQSSIKYANSNIQTLVHTCAAALLKTIYKLFL
jgi:hypothetical protein